MSKVCKVCNAFKEFEIMHYKVCGQKSYNLSSMKQHALTHTEENHITQLPYRRKHYLEAYNLVHFNKPSS